MPAVRSAVFRSDLAEGLARATMSESDPGATEKLVAAARRCDSMSLVIGRRSGGHGVNDTCTREGLQQVCHEHGEGERKEEPRGEERRKEKEERKKHPWRGRSRERLPTYENTAKTPDLNSIEALGHL